MPNIGADIVVRDNLATPAWYHQGAPGYRGHRRGCERKRWNFLDEDFGYFDELKLAVLVWITAGLKAKKPNAKSPPVRGYSGPHCDG